MALQPIEVNVHIGRNPSAKAEGPVVIQNDSIRDLRVYINVDGVRMTNDELNEFTAIAITYQPTSGESAMYSGTIDWDSVLFPATFGQTIVGLVKGSVQLYEPDGRMSTSSFTIEVIGDLAGAQYTPPAHDQTLIEKIVFNGPGIIDEAEGASLGARESEAAAYIAEGIALSAAQVADASAVNASSKAGYAKEQGDYAKAQGQYANTEGLYANAQGNFAKTAGENAITATTNAKNATDAATAKTVEVDGFLTDSRTTFTGDQAARGTAFTQSQTGRASDYAAFKTDADAKVAAIVQERSATEQVRMATEAERLAIRNQQSAFEAPVNARVAAVETKATSAEDIAKLAKARADLIIGQSGSSSTEQVDSRLGADLVARATSGELIREIHSQQLETARQTTVLSTGVSVVSGGVDALADVEIEGRTLISLGNSNLEAAKQYVLADKKTKVVVDGVTQSGVAKFTKGTTTVSTANFVGKTPASLVANPHIAKHRHINTIIQTPTGNLVEMASNEYTALSTLNGLIIFSGNTPSAGSIGQQMFSFNIIEEIERKLGIIPETTLAKKVQWIKDNVATIVTRWYGFGSSVGGNKASLSVWVGSAWSGAVTHTSSAVTMLSKGQDFAAYPGDQVIVQSDGFIHYLANAEASDGITASSVSTDFIDLVITLKATAQLNTRPTIIRVENFEGKVAGSVVENPHRWSTFGSTVLGAPASGVERATLEIGALNGITTATNINTSTQYAQQHFSFNLIEAVERNIGKIPRSSVADKVQWCKDNVERFTSNWYGFGSSVSGNKATLSLWRADTTVWAFPVNHTSASITKLAIKATSMTPYIDVNGMVHFVVNADASDGVVASTIYTDYVELEIELKPTADFTRPKVALYEVSAENYPKILVDWNADEVVSRYPIVEGAQHLQGVGVVAEGENLLPPFTEWGTLHQFLTLTGAYSIEGVKYGMSQSSPRMYTKGGQSYTLNPVLSLSTRIYIEQYDSSGVMILSTSIGAYPYTLTTLPNCVSFALVINPSSSQVEPRTVSNIMLTLGTVVKPFVPRNPSYLYADVKLGAIGTARDTLYEQDGAKFVRKAIEKDVVLGGDFAWNSSAQDNVGSKRFLGTFAESFNNAPTKGLVTKYNGLLVKYASPADLVAGVGVDVFGTATGAGFRIDVVVADTDTGFGETFNPSIAEQKAYFYGWKMNNGTYGTNYESTGTKTWIPIGDLNNARAVTVVPTSASPTQLDGTIQPYKLSYVLATPVTENVTNKVEGQLKVNGLTQVNVESGIVRREKVTPYDDGAGFRALNVLTTSSVFKNKPTRILDIYKNGASDKGKWEARSGAAYAGGIGYRTTVANYDATAIYEVTYLALDKPSLTANPTNITLRYANNLRSSLEDTVGKVQDHATQLSVYEKAIIDLYTRVKALGG